MTTTLAPRATPERAGRGVDARLRAVRNGAGLAVAIAACGAAFVAPSAVAADKPFDGRWNVALVCADTTDRTGLVKGYDYTFVVSIEDGELRGRYGTPGAPASVVYTGHVGDDGTLEIAATGNTGRSDYSVGKVPRGSAYGYTMHGRLEGVRGEATRRETRPCTATFAKF